MKIYIDEQFVCYADPQSNLREVDCSFFDDKPCAGHRFIPDGEAWTSAKGTVFRGEMVSPCAPNDTSPDYLRVKELEAALAEIQEALNG